MKAVFYNFMPPSQKMICPVINELSSDARNNARLAICGGEPLWFRGAIKGGTASILFNFFRRHVRIISVPIIPDTMH